MKWYNKLGKFFAVVFSIIYSFCLTIIIVLFFASSFLKGDIYGNILKSIDLGEIKLSDISPELVRTFGKDVTLEDAFVSTLESAGIDSRVAKEIANNDEVKEVVGEFVGDCINYTINQEEVPEIKVSDVEVILDNIDINDITNEKINKEEILDYVEDINLSAKDYLMEGFNYANRVN